MTKALIFGGAGFIGRHLAAELVDRHPGGVVIADVDLGRDRLPGAHYLEWDVRKPIPIDLTTEPPEVVYNLAAVHRVPGHADAEYFDTNVPGAEHVTDYCRSLGVSTLVFTSSISVYGPSEDPKDEASPPAPTSAYGKSKLQAEGVHEAWVDETEERRLVTVRPAVVFGPGEGGNFTRLANALRRRRFAYPGRRDTIKGCGYVGELVRTVDFALGLGRKHFLYNFCYPVPYTIEDICNAFHEVAGLPRPLGTIPLAPMLAAGRVFEAIAELGGPTDIGRERILKLVRSTYIVPSALLEAGYEFETDLPEAIRRWGASSSAGMFV